MITHRPTTRRILHALTRVCVLGSASMLLLTGWAALTPRVRGADAAVAALATVISPLDGKPGAGSPLTQGGSATEFSLLLPSGAACAGDSANAGYRVQSYIVPSAVTPNSLTFDATGPSPSGTGADLRQPLYDKGGSGLIDQQTANATTPGGPGPIVGVPALTFGVYQPGDIPPGTYNVGLACTLGPASATQLDRFWNVVLDFDVADSDTPAGVTWSVVQPTTSSTTASTASTTSTPTASEAAARTTTTTRTAYVTTTTLIPSLAADGDPPPVAAPTEDVSVLAASPAQSGGGGGSGTGPTFASPVGPAAELARTGASTSALLVWAFLLLTFGRMAVLLGRDPTGEPSTR